MQKTKQQVAILLLCILALLPAGCGIVRMEIPENTSESQNSESDSASPSSIPRPQDDFYGSVNKELLDAMEVTSSDQLLGTLIDIEDTVNGELLQIIAAIAASEEEYAPGSNEQLVRDVYKQMLSYCKGEQDNSAREHFTEIAAQIRATANLTELKALLHTLTVEEGIVSYFAPSVEQNFQDGCSYTLNLNQQLEFAGIPLKDIYTQEESRQTLCSYATNALIACGEEVSAARAKANELVYFVIDISCDTDFTISEAVNPFLALTFYTHEELDRILGGSITSKELSEIYALENPYGGWMVEDKQQLIRMSGQFCEENVELLKTWLLCDVTYCWQEYLSRDYAFLENYTTDVSANPELVALTATSDLLSEPLSELYADRYYTEEKEKLLRRMYEDITASYRTLITNADWLSAGTRERLLRKLEQMVFVCGGGKRQEPDEKRQQLPGTDVFDTMRKCSLYRQAQQRQKIGAQIDKERASMNSFVVNAVYNPCNSFTVTVGIMHEPYFDTDADYASNLGGLGFVMAHEIGHAFDSVMIDYDENGAYAPSGISEADRAQLASRQQQMEEYYSSYAILGIYYIDGKKTAGENYADKGAMECLMNIDLTADEQKRLLTNNARTWCMMMDDDTAISYLELDVHSPNPVRCNAVLSSTEEFYELYHVTPQDGMYLPPEKRVSRY